MSSKTHTWPNVLQFYDNLTLHIVPGPRSWRYFIPLLLIFLGLMQPRRLVSHRQLRTIYLPTIYAFQVYVWIVEKSFDVISMNAMLSAFMLIGWWDAREDFRQVWLGDGRCVKGEAETQEKTVLVEHPAGFIERVSWVLDLLSSIRLVGWATPVNRRGLPTKPWDGSIGSFYLDVIGKGFCAYCVLDVTSAYVTKSPSFVRGGSVTAAAPLPAEMLIFLIHLGAALAFYNAFLPIALSIALWPLGMPVIGSMLSPVSWPAHFGAVWSIWDGTAPLRPVARFWGVVWHQNMRYITSTPGIACAELIGLRQKGRARYLLITTVAFIFSGVVHMGVVPPEPVGTDFECQTLRLMLGSFFWTQPVGIAFEFLVAELTKHHQISNSIRRVSSVVWVLLFLSTTSWFTIRLVGRELHWWDWHLVPFPIVVKLFTKQS